MRLRSECLHHGRYSRAERENSHRALEHLSIRNHGALLLAVYRNRAFDQAHLDSPNRVASPGLGSRRIIKSSANRWNSSIALWIGMVQAELVAGPTRISKPSFPRMTAPSSWRRTSQCILGHSWLSAETISSAPPLVLALSRVARQLRQQDVSIYGQQFVRKLWIIRHASKYKRSDQCRVSCHGRRTFFF
jgi:hypothetical protein